MKKLCTKCNETKDIDCFGKQSRNKDGLSYYCKICIRAFKRMKYHSGTQHAKRAEYAAKYRKEHKQQTKIYQENYDRSSPRRALHGALGRALKRRPSSNAVTIDDLMEMFIAQDGKCLLSGMQLTWGSRVKAGKASLNSISLDRIDNGKGYEKGNVRIICHGLNTMRGGWSDVEMMELAIALVTHQTKYRAAA